jgi:phosphohistidine phosphatase
MGPRRLTLLRHGQAESIDARAEDFERTLTHRGSIQAQEIARRIVHRDLIPDLLLVSPADRAWSTAELVARACELDAKQIVCARELYLATPETTWDVLLQHAGSLRHVMICGHNPGLSHIASRLGPIPQTRELATAALASALWQHAAWADLQPEGANSCVFDDPESMTDLFD